MEKKKILIVDDEPSFTELIGIRLESEGYEVFIANDGEQALEQVKNNPDLILLDVMMPKVDGYTLFRELKNQNNTKSIPIVVISGNPNMKELFLMEGVNHFLVKPLGDGELLSVIKSIFSENT